MQGFLFCFWSSHLYYRAHFLLLACSLTQARIKAIFLFSPMLMAKTHVISYSPDYLKIDISGIIGAGKLTTADIQSFATRLKRGLFKNDRVKGVLLTLDTPGGSVTDSNGIMKLSSFTKNATTFQFMPTLTAHAHQAECTSLLQQIKSMQPLLVLSAQLE